jgi:Domain of unknown function (DUF3598)
MSQRSQWECLLENLGEWQGTFSQISAQGEQIESINSETILTGINQNKTIRQTIRQLYPSATKERILEYSSLSRSVLFFENGAFSQGSTQFSPLGEFGAELGLIDRDRQRRVRLVPLYLAGQLEKFTLINEKLAGTSEPELDQLSLKMLLGKWQGEATTIYADYSSGDTFSTNLEVSQIDQFHIQQKLTFANREISSIAAIAAPNRLLFNSAPGNAPVQVLFFADGASAACPIKINNREPFGLELGWLIAPNLRQRMRRNYDASGAWTSLTLVVEKKVD